MADVVAGWKLRGETRSTPGECRAHPMPEKGLQPRTRPAPRSFRLGIGMANFIAPHAMTMRSSSPHDFLPHRIEIWVAKPLNQLLAQRPTEEQRLEAGRIDEAVASRLVRTSAHDGFFSFWQRASQAWNSEWVSGSVAAFGMLLPELRRRLNERRSMKVRVR